MLVKPFTIAEQNQVISTYGTQAMQNPPEKYVENYYALQKAVAMEQMRTKEAINRKVEREKIRLASAEIRGLQKEQEQERKKAQFEEIQIMETGEIQIVTKNLRVEAIPRRITDMTSPSITILTRAQNIAEKIFLLTCYVRKDEKKLYFNAKEIGSGSHLIKKFVLIGVDFKLPTEMQKKFAIQLMSFLISNCSEEKMLPEMPGWMRWPDGTYTFVEQEDLTWEYAKRMSR